MPESVTVETVLGDLATGACVDQVASAPLFVTSQPLDTYDDQLRALAEQDDLPSLMFSGNEPALTIELNNAGYLVDIAAALDDLGLSGAVVPAAEQIVRSLHGGELVALPAQVNIEGIWYNKRILADLGIEPPATWDELSAANATLLTAGIQPFAVAGDAEDGWNVTRLIGNYIFRSLGADAMEQVAAGAAKLTDPGYVAGAEAIADWGRAGYFGVDPAAVDYGTALDTFLTGQAAFYYMGSWALVPFNDATANQIGLNNIGFLPFPEVTGGVGSRSEVPANASMPLALSKAAFDDGAKDWLVCMAENFGHVALGQYGQLTGFAVVGDLTGVPALTVEVSDMLGAATSSVLWFEALFPVEAASTSQSIGGRVAAGSLSATEFMALVQADLG
jgi:raffinose/stachyose/melibiose transport system substrate-binding protein